MQAKEMCQALVTFVLSSASICSCGAPREPWAAPLIRAERWTYEDRSPGLYRIQVRGLPVQNGTWRYAASLRPGHRDTVFIDLDRRCSLVWRGG